MDNPGSSFIPGGSGPSGPGNFHPNFGKGFCGGFSRGFGGGIFSFLWNNRAVIVATAAVIGVTVIGIKLKKKRNLQKLR